MPQMTPNVNEIMPINESNNLKALIDALNHFYKETKNEITLEYILFKDFNDSEKDAQELIKIYRQVPADLVNIMIQSHRVCQVRKSRQKKACATVHGHTSKSKKSMRTFVAVGQGY
jgi:adenine C2-methylase RlmN of 23S rRNA A2503 and tRNA A37